MRKTRIAAGLIAGLAFAAVLRSGLAQVPDLDLLIKGGHVFDAKNRINGVMDVGIRQGKIARVAAEIPERDARQVVSARGRPHGVSLKKGEFGFIDVGGGKMMGNQKLECELTLRDGRV